MLINLILKGNRKEEQAFQKAHENEMKGSWNMQIFKTDERKKDWLKKKLLWHFMNNCYNKEIWLNENLLGF